MPQSHRRADGILRSFVITTSLGLGVFASSAFAAELSIKGNLTETLEGSDNYFLSNSPLGPTGKSFTAGTLDFLARTPTTSYLLDTYYSYYKYFGPGADSQSLTWGTPAHANFSVNHVEQLTTYNAAASWTRSDTAVTNLAETGVASGRGSINTYTASGGLTHDLSRIDSLTWNALAKTVSYTDDNGTPYKDVTTTAAWRRSLSSTTTLNSFVSFDWFAADNVQESQRLFWKAMTGINSRLSPRLTLNVNVGWAFVNAYNNGLPQSSAVGNGSFVPLVGSANSVVADAFLTYRLLKTTRISLTAAQAISPLSTGQLQKTQSVGLVLSHDINRLSTLSFAARFVHTPAASGNTAFGGQSDSDFFSASVNYSYRLTREWHTNLSYTYRERNDSTGVARSSTVLFALSRDFTLLGHPGAINEAQRERARARAQQSVGYVFPNFR